MKKNILNSRRLSLLIGLMIVGIVCSVSAQKSQKSISAEAAKIAPRFKAAKFQDRSGNTLSYRFFEPENVNTTTKYPVVLYLHGEEEFGTDNESQLKTTECATIWAEPDHLAKNPTYVLAPQASKGDWTTEPNYSNVLALLNQFIAAHSNIDVNRIYIVGFSAGGTGVWTMILKNPTLFAAAMPIAGNADAFLGNREAFAALKNLPVLVVHSQDDPISPISGSNNAISALRAGGNRAVGNNTSLWAIGGVVPAHNAWYPAFHNYEVIYNWMFDQSLTRTNKGAIDPTTLFSVRDLGNGVKAVWDYALGTSYVLERPGKAVIIDAAAGNGSILQFIKDNVLTNKDVDIDLFITHNHFDHIGGVASFAGSPQLKTLYIHKDDSEPVKRLLGADAGKIKFVQDGDKIPFNGKNIEVIGMPAHTWGSSIYVYENNYYTGDCIGSGDVWLGGVVPSIEEYVPMVQRLSDRIGNAKVSIWAGHTGEFRSPMSEEYVHQMLACAKGLVDGSVIGFPYRRNANQVATVGRASIVYNLNNVRSIKGALRNLTVSSGMLNPRYVPYISYYTTTVGPTDESIDITPSVLADKYDKLTINGNVIESGTAYKAILAKGENIFSITITSSDKTIKTYTLTITK